MAALAARSTCPLQPSAPDPDRPRRLGILLSKLALSGAEPERLLSGARLKAAYDPWRKFGVHSRAAELKAKLGVGILEGSTAMALSLVVLAATLAAAGSQPELRCEGDTRDIVRCVSARLAAAEEQRSRYAAAARTFIRKQAASDPGHWQWQSMLGQFETGEKAFNTYRKTVCRALESYLSPGTAATEYEMNCELRMTRLHTHTVWINWLSDPLEQGSRPALPEPPFSASP